MKGPFEGVCPLCESPVTYLTDDHGNVHRYQCAVCKKVHVSRRAENLLFNEFSNRRIELSVISAALDEEEALDISYELEDGRLVIKSKVVRI
ncbi:TPA: hypothetical protein ACGBQ2_003639 [Yersinia enterocolitica]|nr:hypothetical protein [Yersinia enterocolitica]HDL7372485.1 hypothetical protein [Yersinia enterocolitica]HDL7680382.1 hypothetical protein [Yersinia enterocolitica]HDL7697446.1 hypothetical protein [Yersinia enterocolitica]HDL8190329.1 hypothetical protein [Yersinia enterocolitica]